MIKMIDILSFINYIPIKKVIGIIMDGNRRWANKNITTLSIAYTKGVENFYMVVVECIKYEINTIVFYALSSDNFNKRNKDELKIIYDVGMIALYDKKKFFVNNKIKIVFIGNKLKYSEKVLDMVVNLEKDTDVFGPVITVFILMIYDPYEDVFYASNTDKKLLYSNNIPNIDLIIRTGGYNRLSGFLPMQSMNANIITLDDLWPDFTKIKLSSILNNYKNNQNYGR
jgi:undecaprenyl diphosphate synthase